MRRGSIVAACLLGMALVVAGTPAVAQAAEIRSVLVHNGYDDGADPGIVTVIIDTDEPVAAIHADFIDDQTAQIEGTADDFVLTAQHGSRLDYVTSSPVVMEPGRYDVEVTITGTDGAVTSRHAGSISYDVVAMVQDLTVDRPVIDWDHRDVTVTGVLRGRWPGTGEVRPIGGAEIGFWVHLADPEPIVTAADGTFRRTFTMSGQLNTISLWHDNGLAHTRSGGTVEYTVTVAPQETRISVQVDKRRAAVGDPITVTGKAERRGVDGWVPIPAQSELWIGNGCDEVGCLFIFNNDIELAADGTFLARTAARRTGYFKATVTGIAEFFSATSAQTPVVKVKPAG